MRLFALIRFNGHEKRKKSSKLGRISHTCVFFLFLYVWSSMCTLKAPLGELGPKNKKKKISLLWVKTKQDPTWVFFIFVYFVLCVYAGNSLKRAWAKNKKKSLYESRPKQDPTWTIHYTIMSFQARYLSSKKWSWLVFGPNGSMNHKWKKFKIFEIGWGRTVIMS